MCVCVCVVQGSSGDANLLFLLLMTLELLYHSNIDSINQFCCGKGQQSCFDGQTLYYIASKLSG